MVGLPPRRRDGSLLALRMGSSLGRLHCCCTYRGCRLLLRRCPGVVEVGYTQHPGCEISLDSLCVYSRVSILALCRRFSVINFAFTFPGCLDFGHGPHCF